MHVRRGFLRPFQTWSHDRFHTIPGAAASPDFVRHALLEYPHIPSKLRIGLGKARPCREHRCDDKAKCHKRQPVAKWT